MAQSRGATVSLVLLGLGVALAIIVSAVLLSHGHPPCGPRAFAHAAVAADSKVCSDIGRTILQQHGSPVDAAIAALVCTGVVQPQSMGLGGGVIFTIYSASTGKVEVINARETVPAKHDPNLLEECEQAQPLGTGTKWIGVPGELRGYAKAHKRHGRLPWAQLFQPTIELLRGGYHVPPVLSQFLKSELLRPFLQASSLKQLFFNGTEPLGPGDPFSWPALAATLETVATEGVDAFYTGDLGRMLVEDITKEGFNFSQESVASLEGTVDLYHHLVETLKFAGGQRRRLWDTASHLEVQNISQELLGEALAQHVREQMDARGDHPLTHYSLAGAWGHEMGTAHVSVLGEDGSAVAATSTINTPCVASPQPPSLLSVLCHYPLFPCWQKGRAQPHLSFSSFLPPLSSSLPPFLSFFPEHCSALAYGGARELNLGLWSLRHKSLCIIIMLSTPSPPPTALTSLAEEAADVVALSYNLPASGPSPESALDVGWQGQNWGGCARKGKAAPACWGYGDSPNQVLLGAGEQAPSPSLSLPCSFGAMVYSARTGVLLNNELLDLCWRHHQGPGATRPPVPGERPPSSMVPSILINAAKSSKLVIGGAGGELIISAVAQAIINKLWLGHDLQAAIEAPILHVDSKGQVEYEPSFSQEVQKGLLERGQCRAERPFFLNVVQAVSQEKSCVYAASDPRKGGEASGY
ncbi:glutathione hydrolase 5 proenzyme isoform X2 [Erinaceus europaeus]|uniref:Glutathione hydrolase 5 proenzyme isoform X2 n=1 Tax=Erinaceus europaeus TaxID=9365 RepID=A0ABM3XQ42_ERIEU|nr:glutathione hydrolase 5 proenzyme isoform X2 [Erinaceus europaeus]